MSVSEIQWLGVENDGQKLAVPLIDVASVFHSQPTVAVDQVAYSLEVHEGVPVFILPMGKLFTWVNQLPATFSSVEYSKGASLNWVIVLKTRDEAQIGFRVANTFGPFAAQIQDDQYVSYQDQKIPVTYILEKEDA
jgi:hypothetical protein